MNADSRWANPAGEPNAGNPPVRFDEGAVESDVLSAPPLYTTWDVPRKVAR